MKTLIVPTDFSAVATNAMNYAAGLALAINASIRLLHVFQIPVSYDNTDIPLPLIDIGDLEKIHQDRMDELKEQLETNTSGKLKIEAEAKPGMLTDHLKELCLELQPFAVVMGTKGAGFVERLLVGSSTLSAIRNLTTPVLVVPPRASFHGVQRIGFACDFKRVAERTPVAPIKEWVNAFNAELHVLNVDEKDKNVRDTAGESVILHDLLDDLNPRFAYVDNPEVEKGISSFAEEKKLDVLIVIPRKHRLLEALFQKSHTKNLAFHSHIPILSVHEEE
ncbi:MAG: universal stress protein [Chitinophagaceae bacterium]|nr:universal stress protein [Chitinophagaceae bacterium]